MRTKMLTSRETAKRLGLSRATVLRLINAGALPAVIFATGRKRRLLRVREIDLDRLTRTQN